MPSENIGASEDLGLNAEDADQVVGGKKKKKAQVKAPAKKAVHTTQAATTFVTPRELTRDEKIAANKEAAEYSMDPLYDIPDLPTAAEE